MSEKKTLSPASLHLTLSIFVAASLSPSVRAQESVSPSHRMTAQAAPAAEPAPIFALPATIASVNGAPITAVSFWNRLMLEGGAQVLGKMVDEALIDEEGARALSKAQSAEIESEVGKAVAELRKQSSDEKTFLNRLQESGLSLDALKKTIRRELYKQKLIADKIRVSSSEISQYFETNKGALGSPEKVRLKHILLSSEKEARDVHFALSVGANFDLMAKEKSLDGATRERGGDLGVFSRGMLLPAIESLAFSLPAGAIDVVQTPSGFHVLKVVEKTAAREATLDGKTRGQIEQALRQAKFNKAYPGYMEKLRKKSKISVHLQP